MLLGVLFVGWGFLIKKKPTQSVIQMTSNRLATGLSSMSMVEFGFEGLCGCCPVLHPVTVTRLAGNLNSL